MKEEQQSLLDRYLYELKRHLPKNQREEISKEVEEMILAMYEESGDHKTLEEILNELGSPAKLAGKYRDHESYLIGPQYYEDYLWILKIVTACVAGAFIVTIVVNSVMKIGGTDDFHTYFADLAGMLVDSIMSLISAFGIVTILFAIMERQQVGISFSQEFARAGKLQNGEVQPWTCDVLPAVPDKKYRISRGDAIVSIVFIVLFYGFLIMDLFRVPIKIGMHTESIPIFNTERWDMVLLLFGISLCLNLMEQIIRIIAGRYGKLVAGANVIAGIAQIIVCVAMLKLPIWNPDFLNELEVVFKINGKKLLDFTDSFLSGGFMSWILYLIVLITVIEMVVTLYKSIQAEKEILS